MATVTATEVVLVNFLDAFPFSFYAPDSKSLSPSIRVGYMILPEKYLGIYKKNVGEFSCTVPVLEKYVLAEFIDKGYFEQHLNRVRRKREFS